MSVAPAGRHWRPPAAGAEYIAIILGTEVVVMVLGLLPGPEGWGPGLWQLTAYVIGIVVGIVRWRRYAGAGSIHPLVRAFLGLAAALWVLDAGRRITAGEALSPLWLTVPLLMALVWIRPPDARAARWTVAAVAAVLMVAVLTSMLLEVTGLVPSWYVLRGSQPILGFDNGNYWLPLAQPLGLDGRWAGPFPHPNMAGPVGAFLLVVGMCRTGWLRWSAVAVGTLVLLLTGSRTSAIAALSATVVVLVATVLWNRPRRPSSYAGLLAAPVLAGAVLLGASVLTAGASTAGTTAATVTALPSDIAERFGTLTGRTSIWPVYMDIWRESPWVGSPDARIDLALSTGELPGWAITAHNLLLDSLVRLGLIGTVIVVAALAIALMAGLLSAIRRSALSLGGVAVVVICGVAEVLVFWRIWAVSTLLLFVSVVAAVEGLGDRGSGDRALSGADRDAPDPPPASVPAPGIDPDPGPEPTP